MVMWLMSTRRHQTKRQALGGAPTKKLKKPVLRTVLRNETYEVDEHINEWRGASEEERDAAFDGRTNEPDQDSTRQLTKGEEGTSQEQHALKEEDDWTDVGSMIDEDEYTII